MNTPKMVFRGLLLSLATLAFAGPARAELRQILAAPGLAAGDITAPQIRTRFRSVGGLAPSEITRPRQRQMIIPKTRWDFHPESRRWSRAALSAIGSHGRRLDHVVPADIDRWCPAYRDNPVAERRAFWVGLMSALAKHESTWNPNAVGGGGRWYGLLQIYPDTARRYGCQARTGAALKDGALNLSCAVRIMNVTVPRDGAIAIKGKRWRGIAADWGPMTKPSKIAEMSAWTRKQSYCLPELTPRSAPRPPARPGSALPDTPPEPEVIEASAGPVADG